MANIRRPFLDAYRHAAASPPIALHAGVAAQHPSEFGATELVMGGTYGRAAAEADVVTTATRTDAGVDRGGHRQTPPRSKRPLSSFLHNFDEPAPARHDPTLRSDAKWPSRCLELLAAVAPTYDKLLGRCGASTGLGSLTGIVGCGPRVGTTTTALCLALRSATHGTSTLLVDADLATAGLASQLELQVASPWMSSLRAGNPLSQSLVSGGDVAVDLLLGHQSEGQGLDAWARFHAGNAAGQMRRRYERTLVDLGSDLGLASEVIAALAIDRLLLVSNPETTAQQQQQTLQHFAAQGHTIAGILRAE